MTHVFHRDPRQIYPVAVGGENAYLIDRDGRRYLDASGGAAVSCLGHSDRAVLEAIKAQLGALPYAHTSFFSNEPMERLAREGQMMAYFHRGFWQPMDTLRDKNHLEALWATGKAPWKVW